MFYLLYFTNKKGEKMYCKRCGKYNPDKETKCKYCGGKLTNDESYRCGKGNESDNFLIGVLLSLFLGVIGLIIGICLYRDGYARESFINGWVKCFLCQIVIALIIGVICGIVVCAGLGLV